MSQGNGEHPNGRKAKDQLQKDLMDSGYSREKAEQKARETAIRMDRKDYGGAGR